MSVRLPPGLPRPGLPVRNPQGEVARDKAKPGETKTPGKPVAKGGVPVKGGGAQGASAKGGAAQAGTGEGGIQAREGDAAERNGPGSQGAQQKDGMAPSTARGANAAALAGQVEKPPAPPPPTAPQVLAPQVELPQQQARASLPAESARQRTVTDERPSSGAQQDPDIRARMRTALLNRLHKGLTEVEGKLGGFLANPGRQGVVTVPVVLSESSIAGEWWKIASAVADDRAYLAGALGEPAGVDDRQLLVRLREEVHQAFVEFQRSPPGLDARKKYDEVLQKYEAARIQPIICGHDTGPLVEECARLGVPCEQDFTRSLLVSPWMLAISQHPDEGSKTQVMVAGLTLPQLGALVGHLRRLNPMLSNVQLRTLLLRASTDPQLALRKALGDREVEEVQELARQLLRLRTMERLVV